MKGQGNFGYKILLFIILVFVIASAGARGFRIRFDFYEPADTPATKKPTPPQLNDINDSLHFPLHDKTGDPITDYKRPRSLDLADPKNEKSNVEYEPDSNRYYFNDKIGNEYLRNPTYLNLGEYMKYQGQQDEDAYWARRLDALMLFNKTPELPQMYKEGLFDRIFGSNTISVKPQGNVDVTFGGNWQDIKNPTLTQRAQKYGVFDFDMQMNINLLAQVGDKLKLNISNNTKATFDYQNVQKLDYSGKEDEMLKKIEAGNISFPLKSNLISGVQSLFGLKTKLQFGKLWVTAVLSQQKSQRKSLTVQGGAQSQQIAIKADNYDENKDFLLAQYFHNNYNKALADFPVINSLVTINKVEVWVTNRTGAVNGVRDVLCFMDLGEANPYLSQFTDPNSGIRGGLPDNRANKLYTELVQNPSGRLQRSATNAAVGLGLTQGQDFERTTARELAPTEFTFNAQLGYIMLNTQLNSDDVLGVAYRYTYRGKVYQVGEFAEDLPPDTTNPKVLFLKLMKGTSARPTLPVWNLMMKNVYSLGGFGVSKDNFTLNILYQDPGGGERRYMPEGHDEGVPFLTLLNLDRLNARGELSPDGVFDFVEGITINTQQGKIIFPVLEPFGKDLAGAVTDSTKSNSPDPILSRKYLFQVLYDSTKTVAQQQQSTDRYIMRGSYKSSSSSEIFLGGFNIPQGSVSVTAGGTRLVENQDYTIDYGLGRLKIINTGILNSGVPINIQYEDNATFGFQQQNFMAARLDYYVNKNLTLGGTIMRLNERPFTQQVSYGDDPIKNTVLGLDGNYQTEVPALTRALDKLPIYSTTAPSFLNGNLEVAALLPGHPKQIDALDPEGSVYIDNFEGTSSAYDLKFPAQAWSLASTPFGAVDKNARVLFPESQLDDQLTNGENRARIAWYTIEPTLVDPGSTVPAYVSKDPNQHYIRMISAQDVFPYQQNAALQNALPTFDLGYFPKERGPYNFTVTADQYSAGVNTDGTLVNPQNRWGGLTRPIDNTDFEASNVEYIQFWVMDPFINNPTSPGGSLYFNLGDVSEDILKDSRLFFENGIPSPFDGTKLDTTIWGYVPKFEQQITRAFDNDNTARALQDVGYDGLPDTSSIPGQLTEQKKFAAFLTSLRLKLGAANPAYQQVFNDPSNDNYHYYRGSDFDAANNGIGAYVLERYKRYNSPQGNSPITDPNATYATSETTIPESEDINRDNTLNEGESYFQYRVDMTPGMQVGTNNIINIQTSFVKLPNGNSDSERWYQFKIPIENYDHKVGGIGDFRSIRFLRMFMSGWQDSTFLRFATLELGRNQWRNYNYSLTTPGEALPQQNAGLTDFTVTSVDIEENGSRFPIPYVIPPGVTRQLTTVSAGQTVQLNERSLSLKTCALQDGDARAVYKEVDVDMRQFTYLRMFIHAETVVGSPVVRDADVDAFIRIGSDFTNNYYEYRMPLAITPPNAASADIIWPGSNEMDIVLQDLVDAKKKRDALGWTTYVPYYSTDSKGNTIVVVGNPNIGGAKDVMLGVLNPKKTSTSQGDDGLPKCTEVWFDELRMAGINDHAGYAAAGKMAVQLADLGNVNLSGSMHTAGYGNIDQKIEQRSQDEYTQYNTSTNLQLGKLMPKSWGVQLPFFAGYTQNVSNPKYDPNDEDVLISDEMAKARSAAARDSIRRATQDFTSIKSFNFTNVKILGNTPTGTTSKPRKLWSIKNFDFSYSYNDQLKHNPNIAADNLSTQKFGLGYTYAIKTKPIEPFKRFVRSKSKWFSLVRDFNFNPLPSTLAMRNDLTRVNEETQVRNINDGSGYVIPPTFYKTFNWNRVYTLRWELTKSLSFDYSATNVSRIDEPYGLIDTKAKKDSLWDRIKTFGHTTSYVQTFNSSYNVPLAKLPATDWITVRLGYVANYSWTGAQPVAYDLGNTIGNTVTKTLTGELNFTQLYNKNRFLKALNTKAPPKPGDKPGTVSPPADNSKNVKDLRQTKGGGKGGGFDSDGNSGSSSSGTAGNATGGGSGSSGSSGSNAGGGVTGSNAGGGSGGSSSGSAGGNTGGGSGGGSGGNTSSNSGGSTSGNNGSGTGTGGGTGSSTGSGTGTSASNTGTGTVVGAGGNTGGGNSTAGVKGGGKGGGNKGGGGLPDSTNNGTGSGVVSAGGGSTTGGGSGGSLLSGINTANLTDQQLDSLVQVQKDQDAAKRAAEKAKKKAAKKAKRKARRAKVPILSPTEQVIGHILTMVNRVTLNYTQTGGTILPGYMDSTRFMGVNNYSSAPGFNFVYGYQPNATWLAAQAAAGRLTRDSLFNAQFQQTYSRNINATATLQPQRDFRIDLTMTQTFSKSHSELYADTLGANSPYIYNHFNPYETGSFNITYMALHSMFNSTDETSSIYQQFLSNRPIISQRIGLSNPYTNGIPDPSNPGYTKGYGPFSQDVLVPSFIAAYSGKSASTEPLIDYTHSGIQDNPFKYYNPLPNWKVTYNGLSKIPFFSNYFSNFVINHAYTGTMSMNGFNSNLLFNDLFGLGFPSFIDSNSHNYIPFFQVPNVTISQAFNPLIGFDAALKNHLTAKFEVRMSKMESLSLIDYQISENASKEYVIGVGYRKKGIRLPFKILGVQKLKNELIMKLDIGLRDDKSSNTFFANNISVVSRGQKVIRISPTVDYSVTQKLTLHFFFDRSQTIPYVSNSYPTTTTRAGLTLRFIFAN